MYPGKNFAYHLIPFEKGAFPAHVAQIMPGYGIPVGQTNENVAMGFNKQIITGLLREKYKFDGIVCTDWALVHDIKLVKDASAWGVENLTPKERVAKIIDAGCDMFGGESCPELVVELVKSGKISEARIDASVRRVLRGKFQLGLFDNPYIDPAGIKILNNPQSMEKGREAQRRSLVVLKNENVLPLKPGVKVYVQGLDEATARKFVNVVSKPEDADFIILRLGTPFTPRQGGFIEMMMHQGDLNFADDEKTKLLTLIKTKPTITIMTMDRPAVIPEINAASKALVVDFGCEDQSMLELLTGRFKPTGKLPFELPSSMQAVRNQKEDLPHDSQNPLYPIGAGLTYP